MVRFTSNLGIFSERIGEPCWASGSRPPAEPGCHFRERIGYLLPQRQDHWWTLNRTTDLDALGDEIEGHVVRLAVPEIDRYISDEGLRDLWLTGRSPGLGDGERLRFLAILLNALGPQDWLPPTLEALRQWEEKLEAQSGGRSVFHALEGLMKRLKSSQPD
jgi:hypothetical protein